MIALYTIYLDVTPLPIVRSKRKGFVMRRARVSIMNCWKQSLTIDRVLQVGEGSATRMLWHRDKPSNEARRMA